MSMNTGLAKDQSRG